MAGYNDITTLQENICPDFDDEFMDEDYKPGKDQDDDTSDSEDDYEDEEEDEDTEDEEDDEFDDEEDEDVSFMIFFFFSVFFHDYNSSLVFFSGSFHFRIVLIFFITRFSG